MKDELSRKMFERAQQSIPGGVNSPVRAFKSVGGTPRFIVRARGSKVFDADGNSYTNVSKFGFCSYPATYARDGVRVFIVNEEAVIYGVDNGMNAATNKGEIGTLDGAAFAWPGVDPTAVAAGGGRTWAVGNN